MRTLSEACPIGEKLPEKSILKRLYLVEGKSTEEIGVKYGVGASTVRRELKKYEIPTRSPREVMLKGKKLPSKSKLEELYIVKRCSVLDISKSYGVHRATIEHLIQEEGVPRRNKSS